MWVLRVCFYLCFRTDLPTNGYSIDETVYTRLSSHVEILSSRGIKAEAMWPNWCNYNPGKCLWPTQWLADRGKSEPRTTVASDSASVLKVQLTVTAICWAIATVFASLAYLRSITGVRWNLVKKKEGKQFALHIYVPTLFWNTKFNLG